MTPMVLLTADELRSLVRDAVAEALNGQPAAVQREILTRDEVAELLNVDAHTVTKYVRREGLPGRSINGKWRFKRAEVMAWVTNRIERTGT